MIVYGIKNCDTVKKARRWLQNNAVDFEFHDLRQDGVTEEIIEHWLLSVDWTVLINKRGLTWRQLDASQKAALDAQTAVSLMLENPTVIKRPVICDAQGCIVGFDPQTYQVRYGN